MVKMATLFYVVLAPVSLCLGQVNVQQLDQTASKLLASSQIQNLSGQIVADYSRSGGVAAIVWNGHFATIFVHPNAMNQESANTWAFIIGHELAHQLLNHLGPSQPHNEFAADVRGAELAQKAGYDIKSYIRRLYNYPNSCTPSHGCWHNRARNLEMRFGQTGGWNPVHQGHPTAAGSFPPTQRVQCVHTIRCQHPVLTPWGWQAQHSHDTLHPFDLR